MKLYHIIHFPLFHNFHNPMAQIQWTKLDIVMEFYVLEIIRINGILEASDHIVLLKLKTHYDI